MEDIAPALLEELQQAFAEKLDASDEIRRLLKAIRDGTGGYIEAGDYAWEVGDALAEVFGERLSSAVLPDGRMYYNIADRAIRPLLEQDHALVADAAQTVQQHLNEKAELGLKAQSVPLNTDRIDGIIDRVSAAESFDDVSWLLGDPVRTFSQSIVDETLKANMDFQGKAGLSPRIIRKATGKCCEWCQALAGVYRYPDTPDDVYRRHNNCRCTVEYDGGDAKNFRNVWTKKWTTAEERGVLEERRQIPGINTTPRNPQSVNLLHPAGNSGKIEPKENPAGLVTARTFKSPESLTAHFNKHQSNYGTISIQEYVRLANALADEPLSDDVVQLVRSDNSTSKYRFSTNDFLVLNDDDSIRTFFKPETGKEYWQYELDRNK